MATPIFLIDLSEDSRSYRHTALEPGLPLLDRQHVNYQILRKWLGDYIAEPEWRSDETVAFYMTEDARGRLEDVDCQPVTRRELEKEFADDLDTIRNKIKKIRPESSTEQMVHRILKKNIAEQTNDLDSADFDSYFFKCRAGNEDPKLVWCVGYQRSDLEPLKARLWHTPNGEYLGVRSPEGGRAKKRKRKGPIGYLMNPWLAIALMLLIALFVWQTWPKLVVQPGDWRGPLGSRVEYKIEDHRWYFFKTDVTPRVFAESADPRVLGFGRHGAVANALSIGETMVSFRVGNQYIDAKVIVTEPTPPDELVIEPSADVQLVIGSTRQLKAIGRYSDGNEVDLTNEVSWWQSKDNPLLYLTDDSKGLVQGDSVGTTKLFAQYPLPREDGTYAETEIDVSIALAEFASLEVELSPLSFAVGQSSRIEVTGIAKDGQRHSLTGSSLLKCAVSPITAADVEDGYLVGVSEGVGELTVSYDAITQVTPFNVKGVQDMFRVSPLEVDNAVVYEMIPINVATSSQSEISAVSSNPDAVRVARTQPEGAGGEVYLTAVGLGSADVTVTQDDKSAVVKVSVVDGTFTDLAFRPPIYTLKLGQAETANLRGTTDTGRTNVLIDAAALLWEKTPRVENVYVNRETLLMDPVDKTLVPQTLEVRLADTGLNANATVEVVGDGIDLLAMDDGFGVYPPVPVGSRRLANGLLYDNDRGGIVISNVDALSPWAAVPDGAVVRELNGVSFDGMTPEEIEAYLATHPFSSGDIIRYQGLDGTLGTHFYGGNRNMVQDVKLMAASARNLAADNFNAELRFYFREAGEYQIVGMDETPLTDWATFTADATPLMTTAPIARNPADDYEVWVVRRSGGVERKFQQQFKLEPEVIQQVIDVDPMEVVVPPVVDTVPDVDRVIIDNDDNDGGTRVKRTTRKVIHRGDGAAVIRDGDTYVSTKDVERTIVRTGADSSLAGSTTRIPSSNSPGSGTRSPSSPSPSPSPSSPSSPSPATGSPSPSPNSPAPPSPSSPSPSPNQPSPAPPSPTPPGSDSKAPPSPTPPGSDSKAPPSPTPPGSDSKTPPAPASPNPAPGQPSPANPNPGSGTRPPSAYAQPSGSNTRPTGQPQTGAVGIPIRERTPVATGSAARGRTLAPRPTGPSRPTEDEKKKEGTGILDALKNYNRDWREDD